MTDPPSKVPFFLVRDELPPGENTPSLQMSVMEARSVLQSSKGNITRIGSQTALIGSVVCHRTITGGGNASAFSVPSPCRGSLYLFNKMGSRCDLAESD